MAIEWVIIILIIVDGRFNRNDGKGKGMGATSSSEKTFISIFLHQILQPDELRNPTEQE